MKAYHVTCGYDNWLADIVLAETPGKAKLKSWMYLEEGVDFIDLRARREPKLDGVEKLTPRLIHDAGYLVNCAACGEYCAENWNDEGIAFLGDDVYHESCLPDDKRTSLEMLQRMDRRLESIGLVSHE